MAQLQSLIRIECPDGTIGSTRVFVGDVDVSGYVQSVSWTVDVETQYAVTDIRFVLPAANVAAPQQHDDGASRHIHYTDVDGELFQKVKTRGGVSHGLS